MPAPPSAGSTEADARKIAEHNGKQQAIRGGHCAGFTLLIDVNIVVPDHFAPARDFALEDSASRCR